MKTDEEKKLSFLKRGGLIFLFFQQKTQNIYSTIVLLIDMNQNMKEALNKLWSILKNIGLILIPVGIVGTATKYIFAGDTNEKLYVVLSVIFTCIIIYLVWIEIRLRKLEGR